ncbi:MAG TPA: hypothetical protein VNH64_06805 [Parvularculaceae bacterium]|nr:hypothetical protein [Parvularculaceae bacterium]
MGPPRTTLDYKFADTPSASDHGRINDFASRLQKAPNVALSVAINVI